jgi:hypothetical protein
MIILYIRDRKKLMMEAHLELEIMNKVGKIKMKIFGSKVMIVDLIKIKGIIMKDTDKLISDKIIKIIMSIFYKYYLKIYFLVVMNHCVKIKIFSFDFYFIFS